MLCIMNTVFYYQLTDQAFQRKTKITINSCLDFVKAGIIRKTI